MYTKVSAEYFDKLQYGTINNIVLANFKYNQEMD